MPRPFLVLLACLARQAAAAAKEDKGLAAQAKAAVSALVAAKEGLAKAEERWEGRCVWGGGGEEEGRGRVCCRYVCG